MGFNSINKKDKIDEAYKNVITNEEKKFMFMRKLKTGLKELEQKFKQAEGNKNEKLMASLKKEIEKKNKSIKNAKA